jgi:hypothetical protein
MCKNDRKQLFWSQMREFLSRDIRSFFKNSRPNEENTTAEETPVLTVPQLVCLTQLDRVKYRREVLDWRDEAIVKVGSAGRSAIHDFSKQVRRLLDEVPTWGRVFQKPANKVLKPKFDTKIRLILREEAVREVRRLAQLISEQGDNKPEIPSIKDYWIDSQLNCIAKIGFKPANHGMIISDIAPLVNGDKGIVRMFQIQVINIAEQMIKEGSL